MRDTIHSATPARIGANEAVARLLQPRAVALVGASSDLEKFSGQPLRNLRTAGYPGPIYPVNRRGGEVGGVPALRDIADLPDGVDVAMVMVPAAGCPDTVRELGAAGVPVAVIAVSGFAEMGTPEGSRLQEELERAAQESGVRLVGPNCNGIYETRVPLPLGYNYTHSQRLVAGSVALVSHSGAMLGGFVPLLERYGAGLSVFVSCGNEVDLELTNYVDHLVEDPDTEVIALILDGVSDGPGFRRSLQRARAADKPVVAMKLGNTSSGTTAAQAHSSRLAGAQASYEAVFAAEGVISVPTLETLALAAAVLAHGRWPHERGVVAFSTSGAGGILLADTLGAHSVELADLAEQTRQTMAPLAGFARVMNPFDVGAAGPTTIEANLQALAEDPGAGMMLFYLTPTPTQKWRQALAEGVAATAAAHPLLPVIVVSPAPMSSLESETYAKAGVPVVASLLDAVVTVRAVLDVAHPAPSPLPDGAATTSGLTGRPLSEPASKQWLARRGIPVLPEVVATSPESAGSAATQVGYPLVLKAAGSGLTHKTEHGLVVLDVKDQEELNQHFVELDRRGRALDPTGYEGVLVSRFVAPGVDVMLGLTVDPDFGPMLVMGAGGVLTELIGDVAVAPVPLSAEVARSMVASTKVGRLLRGYRGSDPADVDALVELLVRLSEVAADEGGALEAIDLNPVRVMPVGQGTAVLDALVVEAP
ncbi:acetate--CoA ligase family protein [Ornithinimicrobium murale]|uniref:acetate--CoA ligase family protein n=1 Tax=Ornithinimicrobium murale TaxID=1050153 RepID=UPI000E0D506D|nr:acetate--CoA ligase family protein [Ornithinimicrobium murale]